MREITQRIRSNKFGFNRDLCVFSCIGVLSIFLVIKLSFLLLLTVQHTILPFVAKELNDLSVPNINGNIKTPLGDVQYDLSK